MPDRTPADDRITTSPLSRRTLAKGSLWAVPTIAVATAAPAMATSKASIYRSFQVSNGRGSCASGTNQLTITTNDTSTYYWIKDATGSTITNVQASLLIQKSVVDALGTTFALTSQNASWSNPTREVSGGTPVVYTNGGVQYYRYVSNLTAAVPAPISTGTDAGTVKLPLIDWTSTCHRTFASNVGTTWVNGRGAATIDGVQQFQVGAYRQI